MTRVFFCHFFFMLFIVLGASGLGALFFLTHHFSIESIDLETHSTNSPSIILDDQGRELGRFARDKRNPVALADLPSHLINAFIAAEDWQFFNHSGISFKGILRSTLVNLYYGRYVQGASTITQQLVRLLFFDTKKTFTRKIKEQIVALLIEQRFTKEQILQSYLNNVYFGCGIYGVQAATQRFWGKSAAEVTIEQAATLAAVMRSPGNYCPLLCPLSCERRRTIILGTMLKLGFITHSEYDQAVATRLHVNQPTAVLAPHAKEYIRQFLEEQIGMHALYNGGLIIQTTINANVQEKAERAFYTHITHVRSSLSRNVDGGLISMDVTTGAIKAMIGGMDFSTSRYNRATQARRQMGSIFKPLVYAAAVLTGAHLHDVALDEPIQVLIDGKTWCPKNSDNIFRGPMTLAHALSRSNNTITVQTLLKTGIQHVVSLAEKCHLSGPCNPYPSLALGCIEATILESVGMFNIFANHGIYVQPHCIRWVKDQWGTKIWKASPAQERVLDARISDQVAYVLTHWLERVRTMYPQPWIVSDALCKTGTTNDSRTCWFIGSTPSLTTGMYIGCDDNDSLGTNVYPLRAAFPLWMNYNRAIESSKKTFTYDPCLQKRWINSITGQPTDPKEADAIELLIP